MLVGYVLEFDPNYSKILNSTQFNVNLYQYNPGTEVLNLMSLFQKFPQNQIEDRMRAIMSFPYHNDTTNRLFVYFMGILIEDKIQQNLAYIGFNYRQTGQRRRQIGSR